MKSQGTQYEHELEQELLSLTCEFMPMVVINIIQDHIKDIPRLVNFRFGF
jgi:hypothetical protein